LRKKGHNKIGQLCSELVPLATRVYYAPVYHKQKDASLKLPMSALISKHQALNLKQALTSGNSSAALQQLQDIRESLEEKEKQLDKKRKR
jgi:copper homeostasis protein CutC